MRLIKIHVEEKASAVAGIPNDSLPYEIRIYTPSILPATSYDLEGSGLNPQSDKQYSHLHACPHRYWADPSL
jgi:hypothetical protein